MAMALGGYLAREGWYRSFATQQAVDRTGNPIPWYTYTCRAFLEPRLKRSMRTFEYGAGNSTLWYADRVAEVVAVEHDAGWAQRVRERVPANCQVVLAYDNEYVDAAKNFDPFDIVVVDGLRRAATAIAALDNLKPDGVFVWDNSDRPEFGDAFPTLEGQGFRQLPFKGIGPVSRTAWETSILYRTGNCLGI